MHIQITSMRQNPDYDCQEVNMEVWLSNTIRQYITCTSGGEKKKQPPDATLIPIPGYKQNIKLIATGMSFEAV